MANPKLTTALITGASTGIGATYVDRLAARGHDLVLVARDGARMQQTAAELRARNGVSVDVLVADLTAPADLARVEERLRTDASISLLINNAGAVLPGGFADSSADALEGLIRLNITAVTRLASAAISRFRTEQAGSIINIASVVTFGAEVFPGIYAATKSYVLTFSQSLQAEFGGKGIYVQAVLPAATRTEIWGKMGLSPDHVPGMMDVGELVDAALVGFDRKEAVTIPPLPDAALWDTFEAARHAIMGSVSQEHAALRYAA